MLTILGKRNKDADIWARARSCLRRVSQDDPMI